MNLFRFITGLMTAYMALITFASGGAMVEAIYYRTGQDAAAEAAGFCAFLFITIIMGAICWIEGRDA